MNKVSAILVGAALALAITAAAGLEPGSPSRHLVTAGNRPSGLTIRAALRTWRWRAA